MPRKRTSPKPVRTYTRASSIPVSSLTIALVTTGVFFITLSFLWQFYKARTLSFATIDLPTTVKPIQVAIPHRLTIPDLGIALPVSPAEIRNGVWEVHESGVSHLVSSAVPNSQGNIVMYGHNKKTILGNLTKAIVGQTIYITTTDGFVHTYTIQEIKNVSPDYIEIVQPTQNEVLTLYTCTGFLDSKRLVVRAIPEAR